MLKKHNIKNILITGGGGYVGSILAPYLLRYGYHVSIFDTLFFGKAFLKKWKNTIPIIQGDIRNPPRQLFCNVDAVIHLAALSNDPTAEFNPVANIEINTNGTTKIASLAKKYGVQRFIFASSCSVYDKGIDEEDGIKNEDSFIIPKTPYSLSKYLAEQSVLNMSDENFHVTIFRKGTIYGFSPRMRYDLIINTMVRDALSQGRLHIFCRGWQWRPLVAIDDVAEAYRLALDVPCSVIQKQIFNISSGNFLVKDVASLIQKASSHILNRSITIDLEQENRKDRSYRVSNKKAHEILGFNPKINIEQSVVNLIRIIQMNPYFYKFDNPRFYNIRWMQPILKSMDTS